MKKLFAALLLIAVVISIAACAGTSTDTKADTATAASDTETAVITTDETTAEEVTDDVTDKVTETEEITDEETVDSDEITTEAETEEDQPAENKYTFAGISMILPEGFAPAEIEGANLVVYEDYPAHADNISFISGKDDGLVDADSIKNMLEQSLGTELENFEYETFEKDGYKLVTAKFNVEFNGVAMHQKLCLFLFDGKAVNVTFTSVSGEFDEAFEQALQSVQIEK